MLDDIAGTYGSRLFVAAGGVAVALLVLVGVLWLVRNRAPSPFVRGGKGRQQRLQVLDAAAIDARRRIVLIRRDGVEHLVMIGGPTDIVIETGIGDPSKLPAQPAIAAPAPLEAITAREPAHPAQQQLQAPPENLRVTNRQPEPATQLSAPPVRAAIEAPVAAVPERRPQPAPAATASTAEPAFVAAPVAPPQTPAPAFQSEPPKPSQQPERIEPVLTERREEAAAADILEAARNRVLAPQPERQPETAIVSPVPPSPSLSAPILAQDAYSESFEVSAPDVTPPRKPGGDFDSVLEAEMSKTLGSERAGQSTPPPARPAPEPTAQQQRRDPEMAPIVGGDAALQKEVARIFGEMSVDREK